MGINFYLGRTNSKINNKVFFKRLKEINYFPQNKDPYLGVTRLKIHPTNYFFLKSKSNDLIDNGEKVFSLNELNYRNNPLNQFSKQKKQCIFFTGSSTAFGVGVSSDMNTIPSEIHKIIGDKYLIFNLAIPSWNSRQELISVMNMLENIKTENCKSISTISLSGTADINSINFNKKSKLFKNNWGRYSLSNAPEQFIMLEKKLDKLKKIESNIKYNFRIILSKAYKNFFGNLTNLINQKKEELNLKKEYLNDAEIKYDDKQFIDIKAKSFVNNQILINNLISDLGGKHITIMQPDLKNFQPKDQKWKYINDIFSKVISNKTCLNIVDLRKYLINEQKKYRVNDEFIPLSLRDSIEQNFYTNGDIKFHYFYDNSHLTNKGSLKIANLIANYFKNNDGDAKKCNLLEI
tara:strand:+ start:4185 stop:5402 length:1218 start_codon:yes stop_codon:yes gene_type:complete